MRIPAICLVSLILVFQTTARAEVRVETPSCVAGSPGSPACVERTEQPEQDAVAQAPAVPGERAGERSWAGTHSFFFPNGNLVPAGRAAVSVHEFGLYNTLSYGLSDRLELTVGAPVMPVLGSVGGRLSLTSPESQLKAVVGATAFVPVFADSGDDFRYVSLLSATVAYQTESINVHGTLGRLRAGGDDDQLLVGSVGVAYAATPTFTLLAEVSSATVGSTVTCSSGSACTSAPETADLLTVGVKYRGTHWDVDLGALIPPDAGDGIVYLPMLTFSRLY